MQEVRIRCNGLKELAALNWGNVGIFLMQLSSCEIAKNTIGEDFTIMAEVRNGCC